MPDVITLPLLWIGLLVSLLAAGHAAPMPDESARDHRRRRRLPRRCGCVYQAFRLLTGKEGMGYGDFKLLGALGAWLGWQMLPLIILLSALVPAPSSASR
ncbi:MAG: A24 family peptidase [Chromatiales bacterium]|nr:A24 family peptidase [Chromatiales bacterium]